MRLRNGQTERRHMSDVRKMNEPSASQQLPPRPALLLAAVGLGCAAIVALTILFDRGDRLAVLLLDYQNETPLPYPFTIQNLMHLAFFLGLGELFVRWRTARWELGFMRRRFLPEDDQSVLQAQDLGPIRRKVSQLFDGDNGFLPSLIDISILQFQSSRSVDQVVSVLNSSLELIGHRLELRYQLLRYLAWVIPTIGFIGTVVGISGAMFFIRDGDISLNAISGRLAVAFNTTIIALLESAILVMGIYTVQKEEERSLNLAGSYTLRNLVNRLYSGS